MRELQPLCADRWGSPVSGRVRTQLKREGATCWAEARGGTGPSASGVAGLVSGFGFLFSFSISFPISNLFKTI